MTLLNLRDFVLTGHFGPVSIGMNKGEIISKLGMPESDNNYGKSGGSLSYGGYELFYSNLDEKLTAIQNDHLLNFGGVHYDSARFENVSFKIDPWFIVPTEKLTYNNVRAILINEKIDFSEEVYWGNNIIKFKSGVYFSFDKLDGIWSIEGNKVEKLEPSIDNYENSLLEGIRYFPSSRAPS